MSRRKDIYYLHRKVYKSNRWWIIRIDEDFTTVRAGKAGCPGREYPSQQHESEDRAFIFAKKQVLKKRRVGYTTSKTPIEVPDKPKARVRKAATKKKNKPAPKTRVTKTAKKKQAKTTKKTAAKTKPKAAKKAAKTVKKTTRKPPKKRKLVISDDELSSEEEHDDGRIPVKTLATVNVNQLVPPLVRNDTDPAPPDVIPKQATGKVKLTKTPSMTIGSGKVHLPNKSKWPVTMNAPVLWRATLAGPNAQEEAVGCGIYVDDVMCLFGDEQGKVYELNHLGKLSKRYQLHDGVRAVVKDGDFLYVDMTAGEPRLVCKVENFGKIYALDVRYGLMAASDENGQIAMVNYEGEILWKHKSSDQGGWMARMDDEAIFHGSDDGVRRYECTDGSLTWHNKDATHVNYGAQDEEHIYAGTGANMFQIEKKTGKTTMRFKQDVFCNDVTDEVIFGGSKNIHVFCKETGVKVLEVRNAIRAFSMHHHRGRLFVVGRGGFQCIDLGKDYVTGGIAVPVAVNINVNAPLATIAPLERAESVGAQQAEREGGVLVHCVKDRRCIRVRPLTDGYRKDWNIQFPANIRKVGARFIVDGLVQSARGFYRVRGRIRQVEN